MDLLTERWLRYVLALRRVREATLLRDSDKVSELMNFHRRSDTPLGPPVCLRPADRMGEHTRLACPARRPRRAAISDFCPLVSDLCSGRGTKRGLCGTITLVNDLALWSNPQEWKSTTFSDTTGERARLAYNASPARTFGAKTNFR